jgi:uncharacterized protein YbjT (DUF2867 family)
MKREGDDYVIASWIDYVILRPRRLSDDVGAGTIQLAKEWSATAPPASREDVAAVTAHALAAGIFHRVIGIVGGSVPIEEALRSG